jgi:NAD(P)-dependent dehydrogenase (short-subunit alcohol dehydrogenase family)
MRIDANSIALVTGANRSRGIGLALVRELLARGCGKVLGTYREATNSQALLDLAKVDERVNAHPLDLTIRPAQMRRRSSALATMITSTC